MTPPNIALVRNRDRSGVLRPAGRPSPERYSERAVGRVADALAAGGRRVELLEADRWLLDRLEDLGAADGSWLVFNMAYGIQGDCRYTQLPALLEMAGIGYTGSGPMGHTLALDKAVTKALLASAGVATPAFGVGTDAAAASGLRYPVVVKPRHESTSYGLALCRTPAETAEAVEAVVQRYDQPALVEEYLDGRELCVGLLGNGDDVQCLPAVEIDFGARTQRLMTKADKFSAAGAPDRLCPADLDPRLLEEVETMARATFAATHCRDYARVDLRLDGDGRPQVLEINSMASLGAGGSYVMAAAAAGLDLAGLVGRIVDVAWCRLHEDAALPVPA